MLRTMLFAVCLAMLVTAVAHAGAYDIYIVDGTTVVKMPYFSINLNPNSQGFKRIMLKARKMHVGPGQHAIYHFEGTYQIGQTLGTKIEPAVTLPNGNIVPALVIRFTPQLLEPAPYPASTPKTFVFPDDSKVYDYPWNYKYVPTNDYTP